MAKGNALAISRAGRPFGPVALVAGIDAVLDMVRTMCNITGDLVGTRLVAGTERGMLVDPDKGQSPTAPDTEPEPEPV